LFKSLNQLLSEAPNAPHDAAANKIEGEFWTSSQRQGSSIHEVPYRACFKPELPRFFISSLTEVGDTVYDPFAGRGTTAIEAALLGRRVIANDVNPISTLLTRARLTDVSQEEVAERLMQIPAIPSSASDIDLSMFYEKATFLEICSLREYFSNRENESQTDDIDRWIHMVATTRLTGHSAGFFSVYTLPPNQAVMPDRQLLINQKRNQEPTYRDTKALILRKSSQLQRSLTQTDRKNLSAAGSTGLFLNADAAKTSNIKDDSVALTVTSPPFLDVVNYSQDNWLRAWFISADPNEIQRRITMSKTVEEWSIKMFDVFQELFRITKPGGFVAFEVGEVRNGKVTLEDAVLPVGIAAGFKLKTVLLNTQEFTKTSNIWGVSNNSSGTNTNRIVLFEK
jgi:hypothetical protein